MKTSSLSKAIEDLASAQSMVQAAQIVVSHVEALVAADRVCINWVDSEGYPTRYLGVGARLNAAGKLHPVLRELLHQHPVHTNLPFTERFEGVWRISEMTSQRQFKQLPLYVDYYRPMDTRDQCGIQLNWNESEATHLVLSRGDKAFEEDTQQDLGIVMAALRPVYRLLDQRAQLLSKVNALESSVSNSNAGLVKFSGKSREVRRNEAAARLIEKAWQVPAEQWITSIVTCFPEVTSRQVQAFCDKLNASSEFPLKIVVLPEIDEVGFTLILTEGESIGHENVHLKNLTKRETEVLHWIAAGKTNPEIAVILGRSVRTIEKHCENIFTKLGVESRLAAARIMLGTF